MLEAWLDATTRRRSPGVVEMNGAWKMRPANPKPSNATPIGSGVISCERRV